MSANCSVVSGDDGITGLYEGQKIKLNVSDITGIAGLSNNVKMKWTFNGSDNVIDCGTGGCWNNVIDAPNANTYSYSLTYNGTSVSGCSGDVTINPAMTCSVSPPTTFEQYTDYTFSLSKNINCYNCSYSYDNGTEDNINFPDGSSSLSRTKTATAVGQHSLMMSCTCNNNFTGTCSVPVNITPSSVAPTEETVDLSDGHVHEFKIGKTYKITGCQSFTTDYKCDSNGGGNVFVVNGNDQWTSYGWQAFNGSYQGTGRNCTVNDKITVKNGMLKCKHAY